MQAEAEELLRRLAATRDRVLDRAGLRPGETVVDVGAGSGLLTFGVRERVGAGGQVIAVDPSVDVLYELLQAAHELGVAGLALQLGRPDALPLMDGSADVAVGRWALAGGSTPDETARELARVLRPGGRLSLLEPPARPLPSLSESVDFGADADLVRELEAERVAEGSPHERGDPDELVGTLARAGFTNLSAVVDEGLTVAVDTLLATPRSAGLATPVELWRAGRGEAVAGRLAERVRTQGPEVVLRLPQISLAGRRP